MLLRRSAATLATLGLTLGLAALPAAAADNPGQSKALFLFQCEGLGEVLLQPTSAGGGVGVIRIVRGGDGVLIPTRVEFVALDARTGERLHTDTLRTAPGHGGEGVSCTDVYFTGPVWLVATYDPAYADLLRAAGADEDDVVTLVILAEVIPRGHAARPRR